MAFKIQPGSETEEQGVAKFRAANEDGPTTVTDFTHVYDEEPLAEPATKQKPVTKARKQAANKSR